MWLAIKSKKEKTINFGSSLSECTCNENGTEGGTKCEHDSIGKCGCQDSAQGQECGECKDGYYGFGTHSFTACKGTANFSLESHAIWHRVPAWWLERIS